MIKVAYKFLCLFAFLTVFNAFFVSKIIAKDVPFTLEDRDRLIRLEIKLEEMEKRFGQIDKRFEDMNSKINLLATIFSAMFLCTIGFALWDRRTMVRPFETKIKTIEVAADLEKAERIKLTESLKELARTDAKLQGILQKFNIL